MLGRCTVGGETTIPELGRVTRTIATAAACVVALSACGSEPSPVPDGGPDAISNVEDEESAEFADAELERLRALGYVEASLEAADPARSGVEILLADEVDPSYRLYTAVTECTARLIDVRGNVVHTWVGPPCDKWMHADLLENGDLLVPAVFAGGEADAPHRRLLRLTWDGRTRWQAAVPVHHDAEQTAAGRIWSLTRRPRSNHPYEPGARLIDNGLLELSDDGSVLTEISLFDLLRDSPMGFRLQRLAANEQKNVIDLLHTNSVEEIRPSGFSGRHPLYTPGFVLLSMRHQDSVMVVDPRRRELIWFWGQGEISAQHDAQMLENGHILIFDNGLERERSRVIELDPVTREIVWEYGSGDDEVFFTPGRGGAHRLPNGNTLIANSNTGDVREVTRDGRVVWRFWNPSIDEDGKRGVIVRMVGYSTDSIDALLSGSTEGPRADRP